MPGDEKTGVGQVNWYIRRSLERLGRAMNMYLPEELKSPKVMSFSELTETRIEAIHAVSKEGLYMEFGVYQGKSINLFAELIKPNLIYGFDSFEGLPEGWKIAFDTEFQKGHFDLKGSLPEVRGNVVLVKGWFDKTLPGFAKEHANRPVAFIHIDADLYSSTKIVFDNLDKFDLDGTVILFDEYYGYQRYQEGEYKALNEFLKRTGMKAEYLARYKWGGQAFIKLHAQEKHL